MRRLVGILETTPAAHVVDQDQFEVGVFGKHIRDQVLQPLAAADVEPALSLICISPDDLDIVVLGVIADPVRLVLRRVLLMLGRHAHILGGTSASFGLSAKLKAFLHPAIQLKTNSGGHS